MLATAGGPLRALRSRKLTPRAGFGAKVSAPDSGFCFVMRSYSASCVSQDRFRMFPVRVYEPYPCPAKVIFPQLELIQTLSREFERGPMYVSQTARLTVAEETGKEWRLKGRKMWRRQ